MRDYFRMLLVVWQYFRGRRLEEYLKRDGPCLAVKDEFPNLTVFEGLTFLCEFQFSAPPSSAGYEQNHA